MSSSVNISSNGTIAMPMNCTGRRLVPAGDGCHFVSDSSLRAVLGSLNSLRRQSPGMQITAGAGSGILAGYVFGKTSKMFALLVGSTIIFFQLAECKGYLHIQNGKLKEDLEAARDKLGEVFDGMSAMGGGAMVEMMGGTRHNSGKELLKVVTDNARLLCGFIGGILVGFGIS